ncbi:hypothetical protein ACFY5F_45915 [Streptomyces sp. NPDC013161]|uniref:hypothetical protein n=1 Tax=Streptomyces sp. NPDC013161 TaxID=3364862 RepID=UPI003685FB68
MTPPVPFGEDAKAQLEAVIELSRRLKGVSRRELKIAVKALNYPYRTERIRIYTDSMTTAFGSVVSGTLVLAYLWVGYQMVLRDHVVSCVVLCGIPATSIASIFMLKKVLGVETLALLGRSRGRALNSEQAPDETQSATVPQPTPSPDTTTTDPAAP